MSATIAEMKWKSIFEFENRFWRSAQKLFCYSYSQMSCVLKWLK